ncbi:MAG: arylsulfatase [Opitutales bacterium]
MKPRLTLFLLAAIFLSLHWVAPLAGAAERQLPNIVIIYSDDQGYGDFSIQNPDSKIPTPHLDRLASEGMRFTDGHSSSGICTPSRYALLTGRYHWRQGHGIVGIYGRPWWDEGRLTLPEMLREKGYRTAVIGKWHLGWDWDAIRNPETPRLAPNGFDWSKPVPGGPLDHGFDYYFGDDVPNFPPYTWIENDRILIEPTVPFTPIPEPTPDDEAGERMSGHDSRDGAMVDGWRLDAVMPRLTERTVEWIGEQKDNDQPFFLYWSWTSPHTPVVPIKEFQGSTDAGPYGDFMHQSDAHLGQVLAALDQNGFSDNTLVIFSSDNGPETIAYPRIQNHGHYSMGSLRGVKRDIWEGGHRVPFIARWPGMIEPGEVRDDLISQIDIMATLAALVGYDLPETVAEDSYNMLSAWTEDAPSPRRTLVHNTRRGAYALRHGDWLLIAAESGGHSGVPEWFDEKRGYTEDEHPGELYDLSMDLEQKHNLYGENPEKVEELTAILEQIQAEGQVR